MKFSVVVAIVAEELEDEAMEVAQTNGASGVTHLKARGLGSSDKKTFMGLNYEGNQSVMIYVLEKKLSLKIVKEINKKLSLEESGRGIIFSLPIEHLAGINLQQVVQFEKSLRDNL